MIEKFKLAELKIMATIVLPFTLSPPPLLVSLFMMSVVDFVAGVLASRARGVHIDGERATRGVAKKLVLLLVCFAGYIVDSALPQELRDGIPYHVNLGSFFCTWLIMTELYSVLQKVRESDSELPFYIEKFMILINPAGNQKPNQRSFDYSKSRD